MHEIRPLLPSDASAYVAIRRRMLTDAPLAFGSSLPEDGGSMRGLDALVLQTELGLPHFAIIGGFDGTSLVSVGGVRLEDAPKRRHIASIWGVFTVAPYRGRGIGRRVVAAAIERARAMGAEHVQLSVGEASVAARRGYEALGFVAWGIEPDALRLPKSQGNGQQDSYSEVHMSLRILPLEEAQ